jgi:hypothetical protein
MGSNKISLYAACPFLSLLRIHTTYIPKNVQSVKEKVLLPRVSAGCFQQQRISVSDSLVYFLSETDPSGNRMQFSAEL